MGESDLIQHILDVLNNSSSDGDDIDMSDLEKLLADLKDSYNSDVIENVQQIYKKIQDSKIALSLSPVKAASSHLPDAGAELETVIKETEDAANKIMDAAEEVQALSGNIDDVTSEKLSDIAMRIFEASNFQDITGQRIRKVVKILNEIEIMAENLMSSIGGNIEYEATNIKDSDKRPDADLMNGPQLTDTAPTQDDIDKLFES